ncbi:ribonuclease E activity regulator RraA [Undibacterium sp. Xuan67W]|uniref:ribonuclease E activity regulator RraA n=1 Tax=Undibacterium sp. Xuan67W TaxID=3413057 RepID=UPI003BEFB05D
MSLLTCDICDAHEDQIASGEVQVFPPMFMKFGRHAQFAGRAVTLKLFEENVLVRNQLETPGNGNVLVIDGGGSFRCALVGGNLAKLAEQDGWAGFVVNGCIRDVDEINACNIGVRALAAFPVKSAKRNTGQENVRLHFAGITVNPGDWIYADTDGVLVSAVKLG